MTNTQAEHWRQGYFLGRCTLAFALSRAMVSGEPMPWSLYEAFEGAFNDYSAGKHDDLAEAFGVGMCGRSKQAFARCLLQFRALQLVYDHSEKGLSLNNPNYFPETAYHKAGEDLCRSPSYVYDLCRAVPKEVRRASKHAASQNSRELSSSPPAKAIHGNVEAEQWRECFQDGRCELWSALAMAMLSGGPMPGFLVEAFEQAFSDYAQGKYDDLAEAFGVCMSKRSKQNLERVERQRKALYAVSFYAQQGMPLKNPSDFAGTAYHKAADALELSASYVYDMCREASPYDRKMYRKP